MLESQFPVNSVDFVDFVFELEAERYLFVEGLLSLLIILKQHVFVVDQLNVGISQKFEFLEDLCVFLLMDLFIIVDYILAPLDLLPQQLHLCDLIPLNLPDHRLEVSVRTVL